ncbi:MAG: transcriptional regulator [Herbinix sp.]|nr:transcriptional regulator [Herbinix sp.]
MENLIDYASVFKALADETRLKIVEMLSCGELCACDILESFQITQPTLSYHMKILTDSGIVVSRKEGSWVRYHNNEELVLSVKLFWNQITTDSETCICKTRNQKIKCD